MEKPTLNLKPQQAITEAVWILLILAVGLAAFTWNHESVFFGGEVYFTDGDCYARMTRVRMIEAEGLHSIRSHTFENFPEGTKPHTTMPLDALIALALSPRDAASGRCLPDSGAWFSDWSPGPSIASSILDRCCHVGGGLHRFTARASLGICLCVRLGSCSVGLPL
ncbi:MAG: hypothetical protein EBS96_06270 [Spartobacteria bacterium]|nr:hypothetical protein [Spartobacteria bacterium]